MTSNNDDSNDNSNDDDYKFIITSYGRR